MRHRVEVVVKVHCGTVLGDEFAKNSPTMHLYNHLDPVSRVTRFPL